MGAQTDFLPEGGSQAEVSEVFTMHPGVCQLLVNLLLLGEVLAV